MAEKAFVRRKGGQLSVAEKRIEHEVRSIWLYILTLLLILPATTEAQQNEWSNRRQKAIIPQEGPVSLDTLPILYSTLKIFDPSTGKRIDSTLYRLHNNRLYLSEPLLSYDSLSVHYRPAPYPLYRAYRHIDTARAQQAEEGLIGLTYNPYAREEALLDFKGLDYSGNFTRGISFGNNQDLVLNSSFNLQLAGELGDGIEVLAAITDENIPIQPEGNTQQLREFDRIFIQLKRNNSKLIAGDYELLRPNSYFMNYFKKLQGATFSNVSTLGETGQLSSNTSVAISRGQFTRNLIPAQEGNQGPYKLRGGEGERFIIVLAGTEKVFLDGQLLERGLEEDYVIDYNRGEVTFTNKRLITKDSRITVEFEYSDQSYVRSLIAAGTAYERGKLRLDFNILNQQDSRNATGGLGLSNEQKRILSEAGDQLGLALASGIDTLDEFTPYRVAYRLADTLLSCSPSDTLSQYLVFTTNPDSASYTARFTFVGAGNGQYILDPEQLANERVYRWVGVRPNCQPLGDYEPVVQLKAPKQQLLLTLGGRYDFSPQSSLTAELALSQYDLNRFSSLDSEDDIGMAAYIDFGRSFVLGGDSSGWSLATALSYELVQQDFQSLNPYRNPEFLRDWNLANVQGVGQVDPAREQIGKAGLTLRRAGLGLLTYEFSGFLRDSLYTGTRHQLRLQSLSRYWEVDINGSLLLADSPDSRNSFLRPRATIARTFPSLNLLRLGVYAEQEKSRRFGSGRDTLTASSFYYNRYRFFMETSGQEDYQLGLSFSQRIDYAPVDAAFVTSATANEWNINGNWQLAGQKNRLQAAGNFTYRQLSIDEPALSNQEAGESFLGRADLNASLLRGVFQSASTYEIGSGQEPKVEFTYVRVNPGEGTYIWLDSLYNNDGIIQPNEMEISPFPDLADYVRVTTITDEFIRTDNVNLNQSLRLNPRIAWLNKEGLRGFLAHFSTISNFAIKRKVQRADGVSSWNPFQLDVADTALVAVSSNIRNVLFFNQADPTYGFQLSQSENQSKFVQTSGFESRSNTELALEGRWNISRSFSIKLLAARGDRSSDSEFFDNKDFRLEFIKASPEVSFLPSRSLRASLKYLYQTEENKLLQGEESSLRNEFNLELRYNRSGRSALQLQLSLVGLDFEGNPNSPVGFAMLNGLQPGQNYLWNLSFDRQISRNIQLRVSYEGRKTGAARVVHTGRAQVAANF